MTAFFAMLYFGALVFGTGASFGLAPDKRAWTPARVAALVSSFVVLACGMYLALAAL